MVDITIPGKVENPSTPYQLPTRETTVPSVPDHVIESRADRYHYALGENSPGIDYITQQERMGHDDILRRITASEEDLSIAREKQRLIREMLNQSTEEPLDEASIDFVQNLSNVDMGSLRRDPKTFLESQYAQRILDENINQQPEAPVPEARDIEPDTTQMLIDLTENMITRQGIINKISEDLDIKDKGTSFLGHASDFLEGFIPFVSSAQIRNELVGMEPVGGLPGSNLMEQVIYLHTLPVPEFQKVLTETVENISKRNLYSARIFLDAVQRYTSSDALFQNVFGVLDFVDVATVPLVFRGMRRVVGKAAQFARGAGSRTSQTLRNARILGLKQTLAGIVRNFQKTFIDLATILVQAGKSTEASVLGAMERLKRAASSSYSTVRRTGPLWREVPAFFNPRIWSHNVVNLSREGVDRVFQILESNANLAAKVLLNKNNIRRLSDSGLLAAVAEAARLARKEFTHLNDAVRDVIVNKTDMVSNTDSISVMLGKPDGSVFSSPEEASFYAIEMYGLKDAEVVNTGGAFELHVRRDLDETLPNVRDNLIETSNTNPETLVNAIFGIGKLKTADSILSVAQRVSRKRTVHGVNAVTTLVKGILHNIEKLSKQGKERIRRILEENRDYSEVTPEGFKLEGRMETSVGAFEKNYFDRFGEYPTEKEITAYFSYQQMMDLDYVIRNISLYREMSRMGIKIFTLRFDNTVTIGTKDQERFVGPVIFKGKSLEDIPWDNTENAGILFVDPENGSTVFYRKNDVGTREVIQSARDEGFQIIQIADPIIRPFETVANTDEVINFVLTKTSEIQSLNYLQIPYRAGVHREYQDKWFLKQPKIRVSQEGTRSTYEGDISIRGLSSEAKAKKFAARMEHARVLLLNERIPELKQYLPRNLPDTFDDFRGLFEGEKPLLSLHVPITYTGDATKIIETSHGQALLGNIEGLEDISNSSYNLMRDVNKEYAGQRDPRLPTIIEEGTEDNPIFRFEDARLLDPFKTLGRSTATMVRNQLLSDYKIKSIEEFFAQYADLMTVPLAELRRNMVVYFHNPPWRDSPGIDRVRLASGINAQKAIENFLGSKTFTEKSLDTIKHAILNSIYKEFGDTGVVEMVDESKIWGVTDPFKYMRMMATHLKLGLFVPTQLFLQAQTFVNISFLSPLHAYHSLAAGILGRFASFTQNEKILDHIATLASRVGWNKEHFREMLDAYRKTGLAVVEGELGFIDDVGEPKLFRGVLGTVVDKGLVFFREGERFTRLAAFSTAYREWRSANKFAKLTDRAMDSILLRQDTLTVNMTRASNALWQRGVASIPTQFFSYQMRLFGLIFGKQLTTPEKAQLLLGLAFMYGIPVPAGVTTMVWPWYEDIRQALLDKGEDFDNNAFETFMLNGFGGLLLKAVFGDEYNFGQRYGPGGLSILKEALSGEKSFFDILLGASGGIDAQFMRNALGGVYQAITLSLPNGDPIPVVAEDFINSLRDIASIDSASKVWYALNVGKYITRNGFDYGDVDGWDALFMGLTGLTPHDISDAGVLYESMKDQDARQTIFKAQFIKNFRRALRAKDQDDMQAWLNRAKVYFIGGGFRDDQWSDLLNQAVTGYENDFDQLVIRWMKNAPHGDEMQRIEQSDEIMRRRHQ